MADIFLKIDGIRGESTEVGHAEEIEIESWTWGIDADSQVASQSVIKATIHNMELVHMMDCASPNFARYAVKSTPIPKAIITMRKSGGLPLDFQKFTLENVRVTGVKPIASHGMYIERITLSFTKYKQEYTIQNVRGGPMGVIAAGFDIQKNREV